MPILAGDFLTNHGTAGARCLQKEPQWNIGPG